MHVKWKTTSYYPLQLLEGVIMSHSATQLKERKPTQKRV